MKSSGGAVIASVLLFGKLFLYGLGGSQGTGRNDKVPHLYRGVLSHCQAEPARAGASGYGAAKRLIDGPEGWADAAEKERPGSVDP